MPAMPNWLAAAPPPAPRTFNIPPGTAFNPLGHHAVLPQVVRSNASRAPSDCGVSLTFLMDFASKVPLGWWVPSSGFAHSCDLRGGLQCRLLLTLGVPQRDVIIVFRAATSGGCQRCASPSATHLTHVAADALFTLDPY